MMTVPCFALLLLLQAQNDVPVATNSGAERLDYMRTSVKSYDMAADGEQRTPLVLQAEPVFRIGQQAGDLVDGAVFLWVSETGRPEVAAQVFLERTPKYPNGKWTHELASLATTPILARQGGAIRWSPRVEALKFQPVPDAPKPASSPAARLRQMRVIADDFKAEDDFGYQGWEALRLLTTPISRYGKADATPSDGALFAFVEGTDPEVFLFVEIRERAAGPEWQYAMTPMTSYPVKVKRKGRETWSEHRNNSLPSGVLYGFHFWP